ncbi:epimerase [Streptomyces sp. 7G]|uniref:epimerase n=1 Tax=Streptomyces sp. 7G TaxID=2877241 RepID=UPI001CD68932|nr:epimerase [Streptomyces sp. 7G]MCA1271043.1 epimerase [Streptomyces sp. 7G]
MKVIVIGGSGLIGDGFLQESLLAADVREVIAVVRTQLDVAHPKLRQVVHRDFLDLTPIRAELAGADLCLWGLGVSSAGMSPADYERITYGYTEAAVRSLREINPDLTFVYVSGGGTDSSEQGRIRWARVKGRTENMVIAAFPNGYALRPGFVLPRHGVRSKTSAYRWATVAARPLVPVLRLLRVAPALVTDTVRLGRAGLNLARSGCARSVLENRDINETAGF